MTAVERVTGEAPRFTVGRLRVIRDQMAPDASDEDLAWFAAVCNRLDLSPFADQICLVGRHDSRLGRKVHRHQITVAGRRALATRTGRLVGIDGPVWAGPRNESGELVWRDVWDEEGPPYVARCLVYVRDWIKPANGTAKWTEFVQTNKEGKLSGLWPVMPSHMLGLRAESLALRRAFPDTIGPAVDGYTTPNDADTADADLDAVLSVAAGDPDMTATAPRAGDWRPTTRDQADAHRAVWEREPADRDAWLTAHGITDFGKTWPAAVVAGALAGKATFSPAAGHDPEGGHDAG